MCPFGNIESIDKRTKKLKSLQAEGMEVVDEGTLKMSEDGKEWKRSGFRVV